MFKITVPHSGTTLVISYVGYDDQDDQPMGDLTNAIGGRVSGVLFAQPSGQSM